MVVMTEEAEHAGSAKRKRNNSEVGLIVIDWPMLL